MNVNLALFGLAVPVSERNFWTVKLQSRRAGVAVLLQSLNITECIRKLILQ